nr:hypothetical protein [Tanacetum cinerariifolium]
MIEDKIKNTRGVRLKGLEKEKRGKNVCKRMENSLLIMFEIKGRDEMVNGRHTIEHFQKHVHGGCQSLVSIYVVEIRQTKECSSTLLDKIIPLLLHCDHVVASCVFWFIKHTEVSVKSRANLKRERAVRPTGFPSPSRLNKEKGIILMLAPRSANATYGDGDVLLNHLLVTPTRVRGNTRRWRIVIHTWERYNDLLFKCPFHDLNDHQKVSNFYNGLKGQTRRVVDSSGLIPGLTTSEALKSIQELVYHSHKWHNEESKNTPTPFSVITKKFKALNHEMDELRVDVRKININEEMKDLHEEIKRLGNPKPINVVIEMTDRSMQSPKRIVENVLVKINKFIFPVDFIILNIVEDNKFLKILGRPMLATSHAMIDVFGKKISSKVRSEQITFDINERESPAQDIYAVGSKNHPPMLNKDNYVPWLSRIILYARSRPNGKMIVDSIENRPYVRRMIATPGKPNLHVPVPESFHEQTNEELIETDIKWMDADDQAIQTILLGLPEDIYAGVDSSHKDQSSSSTHSQQSFPINNKYKPQPLLNQNFMQPQMTSLEDINDPTEAMNAALILFAKAFQLTAPTNNNQRTSSNPRNRQIALLVMNMGQDRQIQNVGGNGAQNAVQNGLVVVPGIANQNGTGNVVAARAAGTRNGNQAWCYNRRGLGHIARNCTARPRIRGDLDEIEEVNVNCILMANLYHASTSGTELDKAPVYDTDGSAVVQLNDNCYDNKIFNMFTQEEQYTDLLEPIPEPQLVPQNDNHVTSVAPSMVHSGGTVEISSAPNEETRAHQETVYHNLVDQVAQEVDLEARIKDLENILLKRDQTVQTMHMLNPKPDSFYHPNQKMALGVFVPQTTKSKEELFLSNVSNMVTISKTISIPNEDLSDDTTLSVARKCSLVTLQCVVNQKITLEVHNWSSSAHKEVYIIISDEIAPIINQVDARVQNFEIQFLQEAAKFVRDFKSLAKEADESLDKQKSLELKIKRLLKASVSHDIMSIVQNGFVDVPSDLRTELDRMKEKPELCIIKKKKEYDQDIYVAGSENRPPMLNKDNYVPWSSRITRYARSRPNGKMIVDSIENGPYVRRMIATPIEPDLPVPVPESFHEQTDEELTETDIKRMDADDQVIQTIFLGLTEDVYDAVDSCETGKET